MVRKTKGQAAFEYLSTYGWAVLTALIAAGALSYFGFLSPANLLPNRCDFGNQLECVEYRIRDTGNIDLMLRNNFGKEINITDVKGEGIVGTTTILPLKIGQGRTEELIINLNLAPRAGDKREYSPIIEFQRNKAGSPLHNVSGTVFVVVQ